MASSAHETAAVLAIGDELAIGQKLDSNSAWISEQLTEHGIRVLEHATVADDLPRMIAAVKRLASDVDLVVITGGLGPTADDLTRQCVADAHGDELTEDPEARAALRSWYEDRGRVMPEANIVQALRPTGAECLGNPNGTAPGLWYPAGDGLGDVIALPGPPREMKPMFEAQLLPRLRRDEEIVVATRVLKLFGIGESNVAELLGDLMDRERNPLVGTTAGAGTVAVRMRYEGSGDAEALIGKTEALVRDRVGEWIFADGDLELEEAVVRSLSMRKRSVAVVESCTGGLLGGRLTSVPGSSRVFAGGWQTYSYAMKSSGVGVEPAMLLQHGAVSREVAEAMALGGLQSAHIDGEEPTDPPRPVDFCVSITGVAGPGDSENKPAGTVWIACAGPDGVVSRRFLINGNRERVRLFATTAALWMLWGTIKEGPEFESRTLLFEQRD